MMFCSYRSFCTAKAYRLYDRKKRAIVERRDVKFVEGDFCESITSESRLSDVNDNFATNIMRLVSAEIQENEKLAEKAADHVVKSDFGEEEHASPDEAESDEQGEQHEIQKRGRGRPTYDYTGQRSRPKKQFQTLNNIHFLEDSETPETPEEALNSQYAHEWRSSMQWTMVDLPKGQKVIGSKWGFRIKRDEHGDIGRSVSC